MNEALKEKLEHLVKRTALSDKEDNLVVDFAGTNVDDPYDKGIRDGETLLARELLETFGGK